MNVPAAPPTVVPAPPRPPPPSPWREDAFSTPYIGLLRAELQRCQFELATARSMSGARETEVENLRAELERDLRIIRTQIRQTETHHEYKMRILRADLEKTQHELAAVLQREKTLVAQLVDVEALTKERDSLLLMRALDAAVIAEMKGTAFV